MQLEKCLNLKKYLRLESLPGICKIISVKELTVCLKKKISNGGLWKLKPDLFLHNLRVGQLEQVCSGCISETVRCRKLIFGRNIGYGCRCATSWYDIDLTLS